MNETGLTFGHLWTLNFAADYIKRTGELPSAREVAVAVGVTVETAGAFLRLLIEAGYLPEFSVESLPVLGSVA